MATNISQNDFQKTALRLPKDLHARLHEAAAREGRSMNAEIVARLQDSLAATQPKPWEMPGADEIANKVLEKLTQKTSGNGAVLVDPGPLASLEAAVNHAMKEFKERFSQQQAKPDK